ncbi:hypothetical protein BDV96DRAFT_596718 [Lophiotrema nucula]|uniref:RING-type domain-containing protein n=1 Tax=Lophiotrema nucula TaxID=690887 RepID=A0A6A5ZH90_9PLEO|nr:hypothetical protein BDV96DRAFT_596718 [Lophiotrema nucula]
MENFMGNRLRDLDECIICHKGFSATDVAVQITQHQCRGVYHHRCLQRWFTTLEHAGSNSCPICHTILFDRDPRIPIFVDDVYEDHMYIESLDMISWREYFTKDLWDISFNAFNVQGDNNPILIREVEMWIKDALVRTGNHFIEESYIIRADHLAALIPVVKDMITAHYSNAQFNTLNREDLHEWYRKVKDALGWRPNVQPEHDDEMDDAGPDFYIRMINLVFQVDPKSQRLKVNDSVDSPAVKLQDQASVTVGFNQILASPYNIASKHVVC